MTASCDAHYAIELFQSKDGVDKITSMRIIYCGITTTELFVMSSQPFFFRMTSSNTVNRKAKFTSFDLFRHSTRIHVAILLEKIRPISRSLCFSVRVLCKYIIHVYNIGITQMVSCDDIKIVF